MNETISVESQTAGLLAFVPLIIFTLPFLLLIAFLAKRKGINIFLAVVVGLIPMANILFALWLASRTDTMVLERIAKLEQKNTELQ